MGGAYARHTDPGTSHAAAASFDTTRLEQMVRDGIASMAGYGTTWDELGPITGLPAPSISPRFKPLREKYLIAAKLDPIGRVVKRPGKSGRGQIVWIALGDIFA